MPNIKKIVCTVDLAEHSTAVASYAKEFAQKFDAEVLVLYVAPALTQYVAGFHIPDSSVDSFVGEIVSGAEANMKKFVNEHFSGVKVSSSVATGYAAEKILEIAEKAKADLIIMGTHGRLGINRIIFGSVAEKIVKTSTIPVLTIRPQKDSK
ncbi:universal stress protein [Desulfovibrio litoralis]|uniref:Universal stress protein n=1 Tax=Desulfovibrio litoralis DSM 11393 TaxID=1121455 RepID=A0A1M7RQX2_9BACT|nr:universal stress protein [Desulfovibrio litoralis]SHN48695.1 Nucleotide-binding universal stress protein, UspA family [Desulfovibrio litoralis DSM 11393]